MSYLRPVDGCPVYTEYFKEGDAVPTDVCRIHAGALEQMAGRVGGLLRGLGSKIAGLFKRH